MANAESDGFRETPATKLEEAANHEAIDDNAKAEGNEAAAESDPFSGNGEDHAAEETRRRIELVEWVDSVLGLNGTELELALEDAVKRFGMQRGKLKRIIRARRLEKKLTLKGSTTAQSPRTTRIMLNTIQTSRFQIVVYL
jgi:hypothetical protein